MEKKTFEISLEKGKPPVNVRWHARGHMGFDGVGKMVVSLMTMVNQHCETETFGDSTGAGVFGAEKEGAPTMTDNAISREKIESFHKPKIFEVKVIGDPTIAGVTANTNENTIFLVNAKDPEEIARKLGLGPSRVIAVDATTIALAEMKKIGSKATFPNTAVLGAFVHIFPFITLDELSAAIKQKYGGRGEETVTANIACAKRGFEEAKFFDGRGTDVPKAKIVAPKLLRWDEMLPGAAVWATGNMDEIKTGDWRVKRIVPFSKNCIGCHKCLIVCPEDVIVATEDADGVMKIIVIDLEYCKGCGLCKNICPQNAFLFKNEATEKQKDEQK